MTTPMRLLNVKVSDDLRALVEEAVAVSKMPDMSKWVREALEAGARAELAAHARSVGGPNHSQSPRTDDHDAVSSGRSRCIHPTPARTQTVEAEVCGLCGTVTRWRL